MDSIKREEPDIEDKGTDTFELLNPNKYIIMEVLNSFLKVIFGASIFYHY
jgi:hypothetical protein